MKANQDIKKIAQKVFEQEAQGIQNLSNQLTEDFAKAVEAVFLSKGRVIVTGIGKSANIAQKIVSTLNSTGTPAIFMHAADAIHGDLGIILKDDVVLAISKSGDTPEIKVLLPLIKFRGNTIIAITGNTDSYLAQKANFVLDVTVEKEACPNNLAPTTSTTAQLVMGDALAVALLEMRGFSTEDFAKVHPGGALGKKLYLKAEDIFNNNEKPMVNSGTSISDVIVEMTTKRLGATAVIDDGEIKGMITDGDLRRMLQVQVDYSKLIAAEIMNVAPKTIAHDTLLVDALNMMRMNNITQVLVTKNGEYVGVIHLHDILKEGIL
ncbi:MULTISPECIES: SIS domain-containing protein [unclassified Lentimicrobium]|uniref:KpsF/GutQ family sugar-phosphate isomerase n=1 Tax=unclassified Lentimicrobium TaxID=2677434 RepID=UPI0015579623|nr:MULTISPECIES: KpsF/GutQ family sugar-phosphate isomerase [unclassified Lentimicrobium]NPD44559.1 KpsF/GutQ family sugar-phosphate isomerase [Lentimicrobium sp. S6]NPD85624.1 KpsF/GutQ family sugar-phosphate isomerase [Lentimicrobium sp. L6]